MRCCSIENSDPTLNGRLHYNDVDKSLNEAAHDKIRKYRADYITTLLTLSRLCQLWLVRMDVYIVTLSDFYSYRLIRLALTELLKLQTVDRFFPVSGVQSV
jgi:hypothetical protein